MILPKKHIKLSESLFAMGAIVLKEINKSKTVDEVWELVKDNKLINPITFDSFILALDYLYCINLIEINDEGGLVRCI